MSASTTILEPEEIAPQKIARIWSSEVIAWAVMLLSPVPLLLIHFRRLYLYDHYHYFPIVIAAFAYLTWRRWPAADVSAHIRMPRTEITCLVIGLVLLAISTLEWSPWLAAVAAIFVIGAALLHFAGRHGMTQLTSVWLLLWLLIPVPFLLDVQLIFELQTVASNAASYLLDFVGISHLLEGHVLEVPGHKFLVEEACSGIHSLFALLAFAAILLIALRRSRLHSVLLLTAAVFWATSINIIRVTTVVAAFAWFGVDLATAWRHETLGLVLNGFAILMLFCTDQLILFFLERPEQVAGDDFLPDFYHDDSAGRVRSIDSNHTPQTDIVSSPNVESQRTRITAVLAGLFSVIAVAQLLALWLRIDAYRVVGEASERLDGAFQAATLPEQLGKWKQVGFETKSRQMTSNLGARYASWNYRKDHATAIVHIDYPFRGWHDLPVCFEAQGWQIKSQSMTQEPSQSRSDTEVWWLELSRPFGAMHVRFCQFDAFGDPVSRVTGWRKILQRDAIQRWPFRSSDTWGYQVVMQVTTDKGASDVPPQELTADFLEFRTHILEAVMGRLHDDD